MAPDRWASPKYLYGESYGTFRSAGLASELQSAEDIELNGVMLLGTVLDLGNIQPGASNDIPYLSFLPTYTATAWYHKKLPADLQEIVAREMDQSALAERADVAALNGALRGKLEKAGMAFNDVDTAPFRDALKRAGAEPDS